MTVEMTVDRVIELFFRERVFEGVIPNIALAATAAAALDESIFVRGVFSFRAVRHRCVFIERFLDCNWPLLFGFCLVVVSIARTSTPSLLIVQTSLCVDLLAEMVVEYFVKQWLLLLLWVDFAAAYSSSSCCSFLNCRRRAA